MIFLNNVFMPTIRNAAQPEPQKPPSTHSEESILLLFTPKPFTIDQYYAKTSQEELQPLKAIFLFLIFVRKVLTMAQETSFVFCLLFCSWTEADSKVRILGPYLFYILGPWAIGKNEF